MKDEAEKFGYKFIVANSNNSAAQQIADVDSLITQGANYIIITPADGAAIGPAVANAMGQGIPVIAGVDHIVAPVTATYSMDHTEGGKLAGEEIVKYLTKKYGTPKAMSSISRASRESSPRPSARRASPTSSPNIPTSKSLPAPTAASTPTGPTP
jgi:ABC-type sugar transport system substrate-binding protein